VFMARGKSSPVEWPRSALADFEIVFAGSLNHPSERPLVVRSFCSKPITHFT
jgi:hypothetical protein